MDRGVLCTHVTVLTATTNSSIKKCMLIFPVSGLFLSLFYAEVHKKFQVDFKLTVLKRETDLNSANNPHRVSLLVTLSLLQGWKISCVLVLSVTVLHRLMLVLVVETCIFASSPNQVMLPEVLTCCNPLTRQCLHSCFL